MSEERPGAQENKMSQQGSKQGGFLGSLKDALAAASRDAVDGPFTPSRSISRRRSGWWIAAITDGSAVRRFAGLIRPP